MKGIENLDHVVSKLLNRMGVPKQAEADMLQTAIVTVHEKPDLLCRTIDTLYMVIAEQYKKTKYEVEQELEEILLETLMTGNHEVQQMVLHTLHYRQPTLREFVEMSLKYIHLNTI